MEGQQKDAGGGSCNLIINVFLAYYFHKYAYENPDIGECWAAQNSRTPVATQTLGYENVS